jgi:hypothetical protein
MSVCAVQTGRLAGRNTLMSAPDVGDSVSDTATDIA